MTSDDRAVIGSVDRPSYPTWIRSRRIMVFWGLGVGITTVAAVAALFSIAGLALALLAAPFLYIAAILTLTAHRLGPRGGNAQAAIHQLIVDTVGSSGRLLDVGCGSGQLLIRLAKAAPDACVGVDFWGDDWHYSQSRAERNAALEGVRGVEFRRGSASRLPFADGEFVRVVSCLTFHEVRDAKDKTVSVAEALRVLAAGGRFAFVDLFDDPRFYRDRQHVVRAIEAAGGRIDSCRRLSECLDLRFPLNLSKVLKYAVLVSGSKPRPNDLANRAGM